MSTHNNRASLEAELEYLPTHALAQELVMKAGELVEKMKEFIST